MADGREPPAKRPRPVQSSLLDFFARSATAGGGRGESLKTICITANRSSPADTETAAAAQSQPSPDAPLSGPLSSGPAGLVCASAADVQRAMAFPPPVPATESSGATATQKEAGSALGDSQASDQLITHPTVTREEIIAALSDEQRAALALELETLPTPWLAVLIDALRSASFLRLRAFLAAEARAGHVVFPPAHLTYAWAAHAEPSGVRVVILGQDPYHNDGQAHGLAFSVAGAAATPPPSLANVFRELRASVPGWRGPPASAPADLSPWCARGVLLLNTSLSVRAHAPASHAGRGWEALTDAAIRAVSEHAPHAVFLLWGAHAQRKADLVDREKHLVLAAAHPSPLSAARGFHGCGHFPRANAFLESHGLPPIDWSLS